MITLGSLFDGIGGFPLAASRCGIKTLWASEIEPFPIKVTKTRFPDMKHLGDITKINGAEIEPVDIITFGSPCQDLSVAGKRAGLAGERSGLFMEAVRIIKEMRNTYGGANEPIRPRFAVWENVPGAFSSNKGEDFRVVLEEICRVKDETVVIPGPPKGKWNTVGTIMGNGYSIAWRILDAQYWGVPQRRRRIFLVADFGGQSAPEILFKRQGLSRYLAESGEEGERIATDAERSVTTAGGNKVTSTLFAAYGTKWNGNSGAVTGDHFVMDNAERSIRTASGFCTEPSAASRGIGYQEECSPTLRAGVTPAIAIENHPADSRVKLDESGTVQTLTTRMGTGGGNVPMLAVPDKAYSIQGSMICRADKNGPQGNGINEDVSFTLNTTDRHAVAFACNQRDEVRDMKDKSGALQAQPGMKQQTFIATKVYGICSYASNSMKSDNPHSGIYEAETSRTLDLNGGSPACNQGGMAIVTYSNAGFSNYKEDTIAATQRACIAKQSDTDVVLTYQKITGPLMANSHPGSYTGQDAHSDMLVTHYQEMVGSLCARDYKGIGNQYISEDKCIIAPKYSVRRLTPLECERLQGFPDGWTDIPGQTEATQEELEFWREVWLTWDKTQTEDPDKVKPRTDKAILKWLKNPTSDSAQYKALGNSVAVPCVEYVLEGIKEVLEVASVSDIESYCGD